MATNAFAHYASHQTFLANARIALKLALQQFICDVVVAVILESGAIPVYYPLENDLTPNWSALEFIAKNSSCRILFMVHYFGQPQDIKRFRLFCTQNNLLLLEDNAHGFGGLFGGEPLGLFGDIGISSPRKLLGTPSGGILHGANECTLEVIGKLKPHPLFRLAPLLKIALQTMPKVRIFIKQLIGRVDQLRLSPFKSFSSDIKSYGIDMYSRRRIAGVSWPLVGIHRRNAWANWERFLKSRGLQLVFPAVHPESCPWAIPFYAGNLAERDFWLEWGIRNGVSIFSWPSLPNDIKIENGDAVERWKRVACIDLSQNLPEGF
jgi:hypothetical protein